LLLEWHPNVTTKAVRNARMESVSSAMMAGRRPSLAALFPVSLISMDQIARPLMSAVRSAASEAVQVTTLAPHVLMDGWATTARSIAPLDFMDLSAMSNTIVVSTVLAPVPRTTTALPVRMDGRVPTASINADLDSLVPIAM